jgi:hypothetical protein
MTNVLFVIFSLINVVIGTLKSVITIKGNKISASFINAVSYSVNTIVIIFTASDLSLINKIAVSATTNFIGVYLGLLFIERFKKNKVWEIVVTVKITDFNIIYNELSNISNIFFTNIKSNDNKYYIFTIYTHNKHESKSVRTALSHYDVYTMVHEESVKL